MPPEKIVLLSLLALLLTSLVDGGEANGLMLTLERTAHANARLGVTQLRHRDRLRHRRVLQQRGVTDFPVEGTFDPFRVGLYFTRVKLGNPSKEFYVQIDTGSDMLWVNCNHCSGCPKSSGLQIKLEFFDPSASSTAKAISCSDDRCSLGAQSSDSGCNDYNQCGYMFKYGDGSAASGYYISDSFHFNTAVDSSVTSNSSAPVVFGCSTVVSGDLTKPDRAIDGIFGFGQQGLSVISQLSAQGITPNAFSHCLKGENGGGILVLGQIVEPNIVYTPLVPLETHYNVNLQSIAVNGQTLNIDRSVFSESENGGTIIDSGTTLAYLAEETYDPFVTAITRSVSQYVRPLRSNGSQCYLTTASISEKFPPVSLNFAGGAAMILRPEDYLLQQDSVGDAAMWCIAIQKIEGQGITILGDLILKDKIVVYDLDGQRIGWTNYDCSSPVNVSTRSSRDKTEVSNAGQVEHKNSAHCKLYKVIPTSMSMIPLLLQTTLLYCILPFLWN
ncbi:aspartic proteinase 36-like [Andrographis paniculata]|uniref:aspartic proteinase 36-like n=1 Tax=Andrographis paniculata TaxID=175694 RepID=UPI0021E7F69D|nr:aspartic proteinase 36-like [Andrographis paniculata]